MRFTTGRATSHKVLTAGEGSLEKMDATNGENFPGGSKPVTRRVGFASHACSESALLNSTREVSDELIYHLRGYWRCNSRNDGFEIRSFDGLDQDGDKQRA